MITRIYESAILFFNETFSSSFTSLIWRVLIAVLVLFVAFELSKIIKKLIKKALRKFNADEGIANFLSSLISIGFLIIVVFFIAQRFGVDAASIVALLGSAGVTIGLAIQGSLSNIAGGVLILILKPFKVGDYIVESSNKNEGTVIEIGLIYTKLLTLDSKTVILPNGTLANSSLVNVTQTPIRLIDLTYDVAYDTDIPKAKELIREVILSDERVLKEKPIDIVMLSWENSSIRLCSKFYVENKNFFATKCSILEEVKNAFDKNNIEIPYPQIVVHQEK